MTAAAAGVYLTAHAARRRPRRHRWRRRGRVLAGLHSECDHYVNLLALIRYRHNRLRLLALYIPLLTLATANDIGYDANFSYRLERNGAFPGDVLVVFSASASAPTRPASTSHELGVLNDSALSAFDGGALLAWLTSPSIT